MHCVVSLGEILMRLSPPLNLRFEQATNFEVIYGGGEFNVLASLANYGIDTRFLTAVPDNPIGHCALQTMRMNSVGTDQVLLQGDRLGIYFIEHGSSVRGSKVVYDRAGSAMAEVRSGDWDWDKAFKGATWFHWSGITPALSASAAAVCLEAVKAATRLGLPISTDLNYRSKLWKYGKQPKYVMPELLSYSTKILGDIDTARFMLGLEKVDPDYTDDDLIKKHFEALIKTLPKLETLTMTFRDSINASCQGIGGLLYENKKLFRAIIREVNPVVDRVGTGDAFMGGLLNGFLKYPENPQQIINFATSACVLKHSIFGDVNRVSEQEVFDFMESDGSAKVSR